MKTHNLPVTDEIYGGLQSQIEQLLVSLKPEIADEFRCTDEPDDETPGMLVTIGFTPPTEDNGWSWGWQTGDNSFTGGAYGHPHWGLCYLHRDSDCRELARDAVNEIVECLV